MKCFNTLPQITELAGYTSRVSEMLQVFEEVQRGKYVVNGTVSGQSSILGEPYFKRSTMFRR